MNIQNAVQIKATGEIVISGFRHDYVTAVVAIKGGSLDEIMLDGGLDYFRGSGNIMELIATGDLIDLRLSKDTKLPKVKRLLVWGCRGIKGDKPLTFKFMRDLSTSHLKAILKNVPMLSPVRIKVINSIINDRKSGRMLPRKTKCRPKK